MTEFEGVVPALGKALAKRGYETLTPVQHAVAASDMRDADALVSAQTGSGKTYTMVGSRADGVPGVMTHASSPNTRNRMKTANV